MNEPSEPSALERRLHQEAEQLFREQGRHVPPPALWVEGARRRRLRQRRWASVAATGAVVAGVLAGYGLLGGGPERSSRPVVPHRAGSLADNGTGESPLPGGRETSIVRSAPPTADTSLPRLFLMTVDEGGQQRIVGAGIHLPQRVEEVRFGDLSPAEQAAVRRVLGSEDGASVNLL